MIFGLLKLNTLKEAERSRVTHKWAYTCTGKSFFVVYAFRKVSLKVVHTGGFNKDTYSYIEDS